MLYTMAQLHAVQILAITLGLGLLVVVLLLNMLAKLHVGQCYEGLICTIVLSHLLLEYFGIVLE